jgi:hypothetical protein
VTVNGRRVDVGRDGTFSTLTRPRGEPYAIRIEAEHKGGKKVAVRRFRLRK